MASLQLNNKRIASFRKRGVIRVIIMVDQKSGAAHTYETKTTARLIQRRAVSF